jgi:hypothetical protein
MPIPKSSKRNTPIKIKQTTLNKFFPEILDQKINGLISDEKKRAISSTKRDYTLSMMPEGDIHIKETHCLECGRRLRKNGQYPRTAILDRDLGKHEFRIHRKRCKRCGEVQPDYSEIAPKFGKYHENHKRRARQHHMNGLTPSQIQQVFKIDFDLEIPKSTIVYWIEKIALPLRETLKETPVPSSGYWGYDEIHMRIGGEKMYTLDTVDVVTRFVPAAKISDSMGRSAGYHLFKEARCHNVLWINGIVKDCTTNLGGLFKSHSFKHIIQQNCLTHVKWMISKHVKAYAGLSIQSVKPIPKKWRWLLKRFYNLIDSRHEADAYIQLEIVRHTVEKLKGKKIKHLQTALRNLESWFPKIIAYQRNPLIPTTNNLLEAYHKKYTYYPSFKRGMMTPRGAQRILDYRVFRHNFGQFPEHIRYLQTKYDEFKIILSELPDKRTMSAQHRYFQAEFKKLEKWYGNYQRLWHKYFAIQKG